MPTTANQLGLQKNEILPQASSVLAEADEYLELSQNLLSNQYLQVLDQCAALSISEDQQLKIGSDVRLFKLNRLVSEQRELMLENAMNAYVALGSQHYKVFLLLNADGGRVDLYLGAAAKPGQFSGKQAGDLLQAAFEGHFPGSELEPLEKKQTEQLLALNQHFPTCTTQAVSALSGVSSLNLEDKKQFVQGLERFIDASSNRTYTALILAEPLPPIELEKRQASLEVLATELSAMHKLQLSFGMQASEAISTSLAASFSQSVGENLSSSTTQGVNSTQTTGTSKGFSTSNNTTPNPNILIKITKTFVASERISHTKSENNSLSNSQSTGHNTSESESFATSTTDTQGKTHTLGDTQTLGSTTQQSIEIENHRITALLEVIEQHRERLAAGKAFGGWNLAAYFVAGTTESSTSLASLFLGLTRGETSKVSPYALNTWNASNANSAEARDQVLNWLRNLCHPRFQPLSSFSRLDLPYLTPAIFANGQEMVLQMGLPRSSAGSVSVVDAPRYGRTVKRLNQKARAQQQTGQIHLGKIRHLWRDSPEGVDLDLDRLCYHALITGTTGVGKTTTVKSLLTQLHQQGIPFMVLEPAKGEYKELAQLNTASQPVNHLLVGRAEGNALKLNPFVFPQGMALTDHVDRVVTIFNAAFSMSGPMPQLLEEAVFTAYEELGWDTHSSKFIGSQLRYPTLLDVLDQIPRVVKALGYSDQVVGDFVGALTARLKSLTRGSLGASLVCNAEEETSDAQLFTESNIIDLSAMGSPDKRAIVMGLLFMRLCEFRLLNGLPEDARLRHFMVLEEAHVLLKKTSTDQIQESSNSVGLAVEAFASALAEMRAYGQGFMVADQSASAIDDSVIKNTNLKIVMRAPYEADRITLGGALALDEQQTLFLSKLENHTAVIYQSDWLEPVLCKIDKQDIATREQNEPADQQTDSCNGLKAQLIYTLWSKRLKPCDMVQQKDNLGDIRLLFDQLEIPEDLQSTLEEFIYSEREFPKQYEVLKDMLFHSVFKPITGTQKMSLRSLSNRLHAQLIELGIHLPTDQRSIVVKDLLRILRPSEKKQISDLSIIY